jgi:hypothetical protein
VVQTTALDHLVRSLKTNLRISGALIVTVVTKRPFCYEDRKIRKGSSSKYRLCRVPKSKESRRCPSNSLRVAQLDRSNRFVVGNSNFCAFLHALVGSVLIGDLPSRSVRSNGNSCTQNTDRFPCRCCKCPWSEAKRAARFFAHRCVFAKRASHFSRLASKGKPLARDLRIGTGVFSNECLTCSASERSHHYNVTGETP